MLEQAMYKLTLHTLSIIESWLPIGANIYLSPLLPRVWSPSSSQQQVFCCDFASDFPRVLFKTDVQYLDGWNGMGLGFDV